MKTPHLDKAVKGYISYVVQSAKGELTKSRTIRGRKVRRVASGNLVKSLYGKVVSKGNKTTIGFGSTAKYAKFIHEGVNGTEVNYRSPYSYTGESVNTDWVVGWASSKGIRVNDDATINGLKYAIGRSLARNGIAPVPYFTLGLEAAKKKYDDKLFNAYMKDMDNEIDKRLK